MGDTGTLCLCISCTGGRGDGTRAGRGENIPLCEPCKVTQRCIDSNTIEDMPEDD